MTARKCFVLMPFTKELEDYYAEIYKPAIEECGLEANRADDLFRPSTIISDIWQFILNAEVIIAHISELNPNVMYELGLAHAVAKPVVIISDNINSVPFDIRNLRVLLYDTQKPTWSSLLKDNISKSIREILTSPLDAILPTFLNKRPFQQEEISDIKGDLIEIKQLIHRQLDSFEENVATPQNQFTVEDYIEAKDEASNLYYKEGWDTYEIKLYLTKQYKISFNKASEIVSKITIH